jgi:hypothetical protein
VAVRLKGGPGSFRPLEDKPAFTVNFGRMAPGQKFHGLKKLHLNNSVQDHTYLAEKISRELFDAAGVPTPRAGHAAVDVNGRPLGFYVLIEGIDKQFLRRYFKDTKGNLYDGHSGSDVTRTGMRVNSGDNPSDRQSLKALAAAAQEPDLDARLAALEKTLDVDRFLSFLATEVMLCHWDGYAMNRNNFRIFHDRDQNRMVFLPQGVDQVFQRQNTTLFPNMVGLVAKSVLEVPQLRQRYRERMVALLTNVWQASVLTSHVHEIALKVQPAFAKADLEGGANYMARAGSFSRKIAQRIRGLERELLVPKVQADFDPSGLVTITGWRPQTDIGEPVLKKEEPSESRTLLYIGGQSDCAGSWRARVQLSKGHYRFHGRVRLQGVELNSEDPKGGAGLRISRRKFSRQLPAETPWTTVTFDFEVAQEQAEVELVCELRARKGEAWFDQGTLRLIRQE